jgi:hypothetical protein
MTTTVVPALLLLCGVAIGPHGLAILTPSVLSFLDPAAPVGLAVFGISAILRIPTGSAEARRSAAASMLQATAAGILVAATFLLAPPAGATAELFPVWGIAAMTLGVAASTSFDAEDCIPAVIAGGILLAFAREMTRVGALVMTIEACAVAALIAGSGWLLLSRATAIDEQRVSTFASALLLGGAADYMSMSALLFGAAAGGCWHFADSPIREHVRRDLAYIADTLLAFVLVLAGAHATYSVQVLAIALGYAIVRATAKLAVRWLGSRLSPADPRRSLKLLMAPGAFGVAFALNLVRALGDSFTPVLTVVVMGTIASAFIAAVSPAEADA